MKIFYNKSHYIQSILTLLVLIIGLECYSQDDNLEKANTAFNNKSYIEAATIYEKVANKGYKSEELLQNLGDS